MAISADYLAGVFRPQNEIRNALNKGRFFWTIEFVASSDHVLNDDLVTVDSFVRALARRPEVAGFSVTDRVHSDNDPDPVMMAKHIRDHSGTQPLVHWSGKDRAVADLESSLDEMNAAKLENMLLLTGDKLKTSPTDRRPRYLESVAAIKLAKDHCPDLLIASVLNPFKYREEEAMAQYLKLGKKIYAGTDFCITQIGFDIKKFEEALFWMDTRDYRVPMVANVMALTAARSRYIRKHQLAGVTITDSYHKFLQQEAELFPEQAPARVLRRTALLILGLRMLGFSGAQLTAIHTVDQLMTLHNQIDYLAKKCPDRVSWNRAWQEALTLPKGVNGNPVPDKAWYMSSHMVNRPSSHAPLKDRIKYHSMKWCHNFLFDRGIGAKVLSFLVRNIERHSKTDKCLERIERVIKSPLFGCETCGMCRLEATQYVCPETCPKGLANGACGGTNENTCEFGDRECIHSRKYRIAKDANVLPELEQWLIPAVPDKARLSSSWPPHFRGEGPGIDKP
jgi:methylenetetrahydrofolate reductase (NADH)